MHLLNTLKFIQLSLSDLFNQLIHSVTIILLKFLLYFILNKKNKYEISNLNRRIIRLSYHSNNCNN